MKFYPHLTEFFFTFPDRQAVSGLASGDLDLAHQVTVELEGQQDVHGRPARHGRRPPGHDPGRQAASQPHRPGVHGVGGQDVAASGEHSKVTAGNTAWQGNEFSLSSTRWNNHTGVKR